jgi:hypothetical protein
MGNNSVKHRFTVVFSIILVVCLIIGGLYLLHFLGTIFGLFSPRSEETKIISHGPTIERLQKLNQLVTLQVDVSDVIEGNDHGYRGAWLIKGDGVIGIDLDKAKFIKKDENHKHVTIELPKPHVLVSRVDHKRTKTYDVSKKFWLKPVPDFIYGDPDSLRDQVMQQAQDLVEQTVGKQEYLNKARSQAELVIGCIFSEIGWSCDFVWVDTSTTSSSGTPPNSNKLSDGQK